MMKAALVTPFLCHMPFHPGCYFGYGTAMLKRGCELDAIDLNALIYFKNRKKLLKVLSVFENQQIVSDNMGLHPLYDQLSDRIDKEINEISWESYQEVFITTPSWFTTVPTEDLVRLSNIIKARAPSIKVSFFGNSLGSWTDEKGLLTHNIQIRHLNDLFDPIPRNRPVNYDLLPAPAYENREQYIFDMLPFRLKHGCIWGKCRFCSLAKGWNAGYLERSAKTVIEEVASLIDRYQPRMLVCRDNSLNGNNLIEFCSYFRDFQKPWAGMARPDLSGEEIKMLERSGCKFIYFGLESGSDRVLNDMNRGIGSKQTSAFIKELHDHHMMPAPSLFVGAPGETEDDFEKTVQFILDHARFLDVINAYPFIKTPGSDFSMSKNSPNTIALMRLRKLNNICGDIGVKVCVGTQCAEYVLFKKVYPNHHLNPFGFG